VLTFVRLTSGISVHKRSDQYSKLNKTGATAMGGAPSHYPRGKQEGGLVQTLEGPVLEFGANQMDSGSISATSLPMVVL
jgi:hypothetical protein